MLTIDMAPKKKGPPETGRAQMNRLAWRKDRHCGSKGAAQATRWRAD